MFALQVTSQRDSALESLRSESAALEEARSYIAVLLSALESRGGIPPSGFTSDQPGPAAKSVPGVTLPPTMHQSQTSQLLTEVRVRAGIAL